MQTGINRTEGGISYSMYRAILPEDLNMWHISVKSVPYILTIK